MRQNKSSEAGSVLIYIIVGVALFGMLMYGLTKGGSTSSGVAIKGNAKTQAAAIVEFSRIVKGEVDRMISSGISENQIDGDSALYSRWSASGQTPWNPNPNCTNSSCKLFVSKAGRVPDTNFRSVATALSSGYSSSHPFHGDPVLSQMNLLGVGTSKYDLAIIVTRLNADVCKEINKIVGAPVNASSIDEQWTAFGILGTHTAGNYYQFDQYTAAAVGDNNPSLVGKTSACVPMATYGNVFYNVLIVR